MGLKENIGRNVMVLPTSAVMDFYFRQTGKIVDVIECIGQNYYLVEFQKTTEVLHVMGNRGISLSQNDGFAGDLMGCFPVEAEFLKFIN